MTEINRGQGSAAIGRCRALGNLRIRPVLRSNALQLLCGACNRAKGTGTQAELIAKLKERGQLAA